MLLKDDIGLEEMCSIIEESSLVLGNWSILGASELIDLGVDLTKNIYFYINN